jgi:hypothetical protein
MAHNPHHYRYQAASNPNTGNIGKVGGSLAKIGGAIGALGGLGKVGAFLANPLVGAGIGLLGGLIGTRRASRRQTSAMPSGMQQLVSQLQEPDIEEFRDIARQAAPSQQDLMRLAAATGGSQASATAQAMGGQTRAMDTALKAYSQSQRANQGLLANIYGQQFAAMQQDRAFRRQTDVDIFSNIANLGAGLLGQRYGAQIQGQQNQNLFDMFSQYQNTYNQRLGNS